MMKKTILSLVLALILALTGCVSKKPTQPTGGGLGTPGTPKTRQIEPEARPLFFQAERAYNAKNYDLAIRLYQQVKNHFPRGRACQLASYRLGTIYYYREEYETAAREFEYFLARFPQSELSFDVTYNLAAAQYQMGDYEHASATLSKLRAADVQTQGMRRAEVVYQLAAQIAGALGDHASVVAADAAQIQLPLEESARADLEGNIDQHLARINNRSDLERLLSEITEPGTRQKITERLAALGAAPPNAPGMAPEMGTSPPPALAPGSLADRYNVGVVLPLTGRFAPYGKRALDGILLSARNYSANRDIDLHLYVEDSAGNPAQAQQAVDTLFYQHRVMAIIGPLNWKESLAVADRSQQLGILNLSLSAKEGISEHGAYLFQNALTPRVQIDNLVRYCINEKHFSRFAVMAPSNSFGKDLANDFWDIVEKYAGKVVAYITYPSEEKDFQKEVQELTGLNNLKFRRLENAKLAEFITAQKAKTGREPKAHLPPLIDFDAIFIPDSPKTGAQIAASLAYFDASGIPLLGTTEWNSDLLYKRGGRYVEGAIFPGGVSLATRNARQREFIRFYSDAYGTAPDLLASQAYEAMELVGAAIRKDSSGDRNELVNALAGMHDFETPLGNLTFDQTRIAQRRIPIYRLESGGNIVEE